jgi:GrpB-like predicted nucleotidyltransferase (UPF0157 family)
VADQQLKVVDPDPAWANRFAEQQIVVEDLLRPRPGARSHHLQVADGEHPNTRALVAFRDVLRADAGLRREYASLKEQLAAQHPDSRNAYTNAKRAFIKRALRQAGIDPPPRELLPE